MPKTVIEWWRTEVPLNANDYRIEAEVRLLGFDIQMKIEEFVENIQAFEKHGITLVQSYKRMPSTLTFENVPEEQLVNILQSNEAFLHLELPHEQETAMIRCFEPGYLSSISVV